MLFFHTDRQQTPNEVAVISFRAFALRLAGAAFGGVLFAMALPPLNISFLVIFSLALLTWLIFPLTVGRAAWCGFVWGCAWALPAFFWLREIDPAVPFLMAPVLALWPMLWSALVPFWRRTLLIPPAIRARGAAAIADYRRQTIPQWRIFMFAALLAACWVVLEFSRSTMLPWNNIATVMWQNHPMLLLAPVTGQYGIGFLLALLGFSLGAAFHFRRRDSRRHLVAPGLSLLLLIAVPAAAGLVRPSEAAGEINLRAGVVQGDISQRRNASYGQASEAMLTYLAQTDELTRRQLPYDLIIWPETATPFPFIGPGELSKYLRGEIYRRVAKSQKPLLFGTIHYAQRAGQLEVGTTNSAIMVSPGDRNLQIYSKTHRVPFGEYIPFRKYLPSFLVKKIDMNRDLVPGTTYTPLELKPGVFAGMAICFESVFPYIARESARRGANMLLVISNDAWYPTSCEPEQHLANAVMRSAETWLPSLRCGNNGGTLTILPGGRIGQVLPTRGSERPELRRGRANGVLELSVPVTPRLTFYVRNGEWFIMLCGVAIAVMSGAALANQRALRRIQSELLKNEPPVKP